MNISIHDVFGISNIRTCWYYSTNSRIIPISRKHQHNFFKQSQVILLKSFTLFFFHFILLCNVPSSSKYPNSISIPFIRGLITIRLLPFITSRPKGRFHLAFKFHAWCTLHSYLYLLWPWSSINIGEKHISKNSILILRIWNCIRHGNWSIPEHNMWGMVGAWNDFTKTWFFSFNICQNRFAFNRV